MNQTCSRCGNKLEKERVSTSRAWVCRACQRIRSKVLYETKKQISKYNNSRNSQ